MLRCVVATLATSAMHGGIHGMIEQYMTPIYKKQLLESSLCSPSFQLTVCIIQSLSHTAGLLVLSG